MSDVEDEVSWLKSFVAEKFALIVTRARNPRDPSGNSQCFGIAQHATIESDGRLLYHEGRVDDKITGKKSQRHAWNTLSGGIVDLSLTQNPEDGTLTDSVKTYENYRPERSCTVDEVRSVLTERNGGLDWIENPTFPEHQILNLRKRLNEFEVKAAKHRKAALDGDETLTAEGISHGELASFYADQARTCARQIETLSKYMR